MANHTLQLILDVGFEARRFGNAKRPGADHFTTTHRS